MGVTIGRRTRLRKPVGGGPGWSVAGRYVLVSPLAWCAWSLGTEACREEKEITKHNRAPWSCLRGGVRWTVAPKKMGTIAR